MSGKQELKQAYNEWYEKQPTAGFTVSKGDRDFYAGIIKILQPQPEKSLLDVGCGTGKFLRLAAELGLKTSGIDISEVAVEAACRNLPDSEIRCGMAEELPWQDNLFDYVVCLGSLEHFHHSEDAVREMARVLKPDGLACILVPNSYFIGFVLMAWLRGLAPDQSGQPSESFGTRLEWQNVLQSNFEVLRIYKYNQWLKTPKVKGYLMIPYNVFIRYLLPLNLSDHFAFLCRKNIGGRKELKKP